jgi:type I restriction enzyme M protein
VQLLVEMLEPRANTRIFDPCCGSGGMFVQSEKFIAEHGGRRRSAAVFGQEYNHTTWRLCKMNLEVRGIEGNILEGDTFSNDRHPDLRADFVMANPPFNMSTWGGEKLREDVRWKYGVPPVGNANYAWIQHFIHHLAPTGCAGFVMANGSMSSNTSSEGDIRRAIIEADLVDCMVALPGQLFYTTQIPVCLWFLARNKANGKFRDRRGQTLFIDARKMGTMIDRIHRELTSDDIQTIARTYHAWRGEKEAGAYADVPGFCKSATLDDIKQHGYILTPGRYVGAAEVEEDDEPFEDKMRRLTEELRETTRRSWELDKVIWKNLERMGYGE